ncbi:hypothetical protein IHE44_0011733 [Lamprotornis superbus]|uniref:ZBT7C protein n=1 Tax=Lamprotornis superbus TaxID=245042 RepID=A0A835TSD3_9PASS|nr:hypothetical protein IHE44_0011733 [Lamprotornis superbus]
MEALNENMANGIEDLIGIPFPNHSSEVLCGLNEQRHDGLLCDVILIVQDQEYRTHRSVLAACSKYFKKLFTTGTLTDQPYVYEIDFVKPEALSAILEFAYTSTLTITTSNVKHILSAAKMLEIQSIINVCLEIMEPDREAEEEDDKEDDDDDEDEDEDEEEEEEEEEVEDFVNQENLADVQEVSCHQSPSESDLTEEAYTEAPKDFPNHFPASNSSGHLGMIRDFSIESLLSENLYPKANIPERRPALSPFAPGFFPHLATQFGGVFPPWPLEEERKIKPKASQQCPICNKVIMGAGKLPRHMRTHTGEKPYMCNICEVRFTSSQSPNRSPNAIALRLFTHMERGSPSERASSPAPSSCSPCHIPLGCFTTEHLTPPASEQLQVEPQTSPAFPGDAAGAGRIGRIGFLPPARPSTHWERPQDELPSFPSPPALIPIREAKEQSQPHSFCPKTALTELFSFCRQDKLKIHMRKHTGERPYLCIHCNAKFVHNYDLKNHMRIHTGIRPYQCEFCYKSFTRSDHLHRHIKRQSCRIARPRRGRKPAAWRAAGLLFAPGAQPVENSFVMPPTLEEMSSHLSSTAMCLPGPSPKHFLSGAKTPFSLQELESQIEETQMKLFRRAQMDMERNAGIFAFALGHNENLAAQPFFPLPDPWSTGFSGLAGLSHVAPISEASN